MERLHSYPYVHCMNEHSRGQIAGGQKGIVHNQNTGGNTLIYERQVLNLTSIMHGYSQGGLPYSLFHVNHSDIKGPASTFLQVSYAAR